MDGVLTTTFLSAVTLTGQGLSSVLAATLKTHKSLSKTHSDFRNYKCITYSHKIRVDGSAGGVFKELVHEMSGLICAPRLSEICLA